MGVQNQTLTKSSLKLFQLVQHNSSTVTTLSSSALMNMARAAEQAQRGSSVSGNLFLTLLSVVPSISVNVFVHVSSKVFGSYQFSLGRSKQRRSQIQVRYSVSENGQVVKEDSDP